jgi:hypothetical protein
MNGMTFQARAKFQEILGLAFVANTSRQAAARFLLEYSSLPKLVVFMVEKACIAVPVLVSSIVARSHAGLSMQRLLHVKDPS